MERILRIGKTNWLQGPVRSCLTSHQQKGKGKARDVAGILGKRFSRSSDRARLKDVWDSHRGGKFSLRATSSESMRRKNERGRDLRFGSRRPLGGTPKRGEDGKGLRQRIGPRGRRKKNYHGKKREGKNNTEQAVAKDRGTQIESRDSPLVVAKSRRPLKKTDVSCALST